MNEYMYDIWYVFSIFNTFIRTFSRMKSTAQEWERADRRRYASAWRWLTTPNVPASYSSRAIINNFIVIIIVLGVEPMLLRIHNKYMFAMKLDSLA